MRSDQNGPFAMKIVIFKNNHSLTEPALVRVFVAVTEYSTKTTQGREGFILTHHSFRWVSPRLLGLLCLSRTLWWLGLCGRGAEEVLHFMVARKQERKRQTEVGRERERDTESRRVLLSPFYSIGSSQPVGATHVPHRTSPLS
jgi:hypothetical protein